MVVVGQTYKVKTSYGKEVVAEYLGLVGRSEERFRTHRTGRHTHYGWRYRVPGMTFRLKFLVPLLPVILEISAMVLILPPPKTCGE